MKKTHRKTRKVFDIDGDAHFLTFSCFRRLPLLSKERTAQWMVDAIKISRTKNPFDLWAWVVMPEHVHLVLLPHLGVRMASILTTMKQSVSRRAINWLKENNVDFLNVLLDRQPNGNHAHRFWQRGGGYDRNLRSIRDIHEKIRYVHLNPVRRQLVKKTTDWKWSSALAWRNGSTEPVRIDRESVPGLTNFDDDMNSHLLR